MPAPFHCNECGFDTKVKDELAGKRIKCPKCQAVGQVGGSQSGAAAATATAAKKGKKQKSDESEADLLAMNLDSFKDVEVPEGEVLDESQVKKAPKEKKKKKAGKSLDPQVKFAATIFSLISCLVIAGLVYFLGPVLLEAYQDWTSEKKPEPGQQDGAAVAPENPG